MDLQYLNTESVAYWYLRLNGFFQMHSFVVHPKGKGPQRTDADLIGVRFPHRAERYFDDPGDVMEDHQMSINDDMSSTSVWIVEVKSNQPCALNGPWSASESQNVHRVMSAIGCLEVEEIPCCAEALYSCGFYQGKHGVNVRLVCIGAKENEELYKTHHEVRQILWSDLLSFIGERLHRYRTQKSQVEQWDGVIRQLQELVSDYSYCGDFDCEAFVCHCLSELGINR